MVHSIKIRPMRKTEISIELLRRMKLIRMAEETIAARYSQNKMRCPTHLCTGQEAVSAAVGFILSKDDFAVSSHRAHGNYLGKGGSLGAMLAEIYGKATGCSAGKGGSVHLIDKSVGFMGSTAIVANQIPIGVGLGLSIALNRTKQVSCVFFGEGATEEGVFYESVNFAVLKKLPVLFICENNLYSVYSSLKDRQPAGREITKMVQGLGCPAQKGDGNDVLEVYEKVKKAVALIRGGKGPYFFEFSTYRWRQHCGPDFDNNIGYRSEKEFLAWKKKDPVSRLEKDILKKGMLSRQQIDRMEQEIKSKIDAAFQFAEDSPFPQELETYTQLFKE